MTLTEQVFRKMGADIKPCLEYGGGGSDTIFSWQLNGEAISNSVHLGKYPDSLHLPLIDSSWEVCAKFLVPFMREKGLEWHIEFPEVSRQRFLYWDDWGNKQLVGKRILVKNDNIAKAACQAFMEVEL